MLIMLLLRFSSQFILDCQVDYIEVNDLTDNPCTGGSLSEETPSQEPASGGTSSRETAARYSVGGQITADAKKVKALTMWVKALRKQVWSLQQMLAKERRLKSVLVQFFTTR